MNVDSAWCRCLLALKVKGSGTLLVRLYKDNALILGRLLRVLTKPILEGSKIALIGPIDLI